MVKFGQKWRILGQILPFWGILEKSNSGGTPPENFWEIAENYFYGKTSV